MDVGAGGGHGVHVIAPFDAAGRRAIWELLAERLLPDGRAVLNLQPPAEPVAVPSTQLSDLGIGRRRYEGWGEAEPAGADLVTWRMTYRIFQDGELAEEAQVDYAWWVLNEKRLRAELDDHGLSLAPTGPSALGLWLVTRSPA